MKTNIILIGFDLTFLSKFAIKLAKALGYTYVNVEMNYDVALLKNIDIPLIQEEPLARINERGLLSSISGEEHIVACLPVDMFIANNNYKLFKNSYRILVVNNSNKDFVELKNIENFIKKRVDLVLKQENLKIDEILEKCKG